MPAGQIKNVAFESPGVPSGKEMWLGVDARVDGKLSGGSNPWLVVRLNGKALVAADLRNKPLNFTMKNGQDAAWVKGNRWRLVVAPDFSGAIRTADLPVAIPDADPFRFEWNVTGALKPGKNVLSFEMASLHSTPYTTVLRNLELLVKEPGEGQTVLSGDGAGRFPEPMIADQVPPASRPSVELSSTGGFAVEVGGQRAEIETHVATANYDARTQFGSARTVRSGSQGESRLYGDGFILTRIVRPTSDRVEIEDRIQNTSDRLIGFVVENRTPAKGARVFLGGMESKAGTSMIEPRNPTVTLERPAWSFAMVAEDDVLRPQATLAFEDGDAILATRELGVEAGKTQTLKWAVQPAVGGDYWDVVNGIRRAWDVNRPLPGLSTFDLGLQRDPTWVDSQGLDLVLSGQTTWTGQEARDQGSKDDENLAEGSAIQSALDWFKKFTNWDQGLKKAKREPKTLIYLMDSLNTEPGAQRKYADARHLLENGDHLTTPFRYPVYHYTPTTTNSYGKKLDDTLRWLVEDKNVDGVYFDGFELATGNERYNYNTDLWDGITVEMNPRTHEVEGKRSINVLLSQPWKVDAVNYLRRNGKIILANGAPTTQTMQNLHVPRFVEVNSFSNLTQQNLSTPLGLGTMLGAEDPASLATMAMGMLAKGGVLIPYQLGDQVAPFLREFFPLTPLRLESGAVLGRERILTSRSGRFGWRSGAASRVEVFGPDGMPAQPKSMRQVTENGRTLTDLELGKGQFAVLVR